MQHLSRRIALGASLALVVLLGAVSSADAHYVRINWTYASGKSCADSAKKDPVSFVYEGTGALIRNALRDVTHHTGWDHDDPDSFAGADFYHQYRDHGYCLRQDAERANRRGPLNDRYHARFVKVDHRAPNGNWYTFMTPHREDWVARSATSWLPACGVGSHAVEPGHADEDGPDEWRRYYSGFDRAKDDLTHAVLQGGHRHQFHQVQFRNTQSMRQCNGWYSGSGGRAHVMSLGRRR